MPRARPGQLWAKERKGSTVSVLLVVEVSGDGQIVECLEWFPQFPCPSGHQWIAVNSFPDWIRQRPRAKLLSEAIDA